MEFKIRKLSYVFWTLAVLSAIPGLLSFIYGLFSLEFWKNIFAVFTIEFWKTYWSLIIIPCLFTGIALTLTLVSKALREISISTIKMLEDQKKVSK